MAAFSQTKCSSSTSSSSTSITSIINLSRSSLSSLLDPVVVDRQVLWSSYVSEEAPNIDDYGGSSRLFSRSATTNDYTAGTGTMAAATTTKTTTTTEKKRIIIKLSNSSSNRGSDSKKKKFSPFTDPRNGLLSFQEKTHSTPTKDEKMMTSSLPNDNENRFDNLIDDQELWDATSYSDAFFAMKSLLQQHQYAVVGSHNVPFVLRNMIHAVMMGNDDSDVGPSTIIGQELEELVQQGKVRMIKLFTTNTTAYGADATQDVAIFEEALFLGEAQRILLQCCENIDSNDRTYTSSHRITLADRFSHALQRIHTMHVTEVDLIRYMTSYRPTTTHDPPSSDPVSHYPSLDCKKEGDIHVLLRAGLLIPKPQTRCLSLGTTTSCDHVTPNTVYYLSLPGMGEASRCIDKGRQELLLRIKRSMHKEIKQSTLLSKPMKNSPFSSIFHLKDLLSSGKVRLSKMPCGIFVKLGIQ